uniref:DNA-directed RNA polymerase n=1 Tax=viral metagenome TaxID=1070528 RepID=A0A6C0L3W7_9ZZZZ|tara:strand:- start:245 stop:604 length:360 start_codon:yes stop_codon:yes gene_type:complete
MSDSNILSDQSDEESYDVNVNMTNLNIEELNSFKENYEELKKTYITRPVLTKYEMTKIVSERSQQLVNGGVSFLKNPEAYNSPYEISLEELRQKKIPFIVKRPISNRFEYWKLEDLRII